MPSSVTPASSLLDSEQLTPLLEQTENELQQVQQRLAELAALRAEQQALEERLSRLEQFKQSLQALSSGKPLSASSPVAAGQAAVERLRGQTFYPERAFSEGGKTIPRKGSISYELYCAVVYQGGRATSKQIKESLIQQGTKLPQSGEGFESVSLSALNPRLAQLVKKGALLMEGNGVYWAAFGWGA